MNGTTSMDESAVAGGSCTAAMGASDGSDGKGRDHGREALVLAGWRSFSVGDRSTLDEQAAR